MNLMLQTQLQKKQAPRQQKGVGMMEVLIALLVLSIGILGLATLQSIGLKYNHQSYQRTQAILQVYDMADRIRANSPGKATAYDSLTSTPGLTTPGTNCTGFGVTCTSVARANYDIDSWGISLEANLGTGATGSVARQGTTPIHVITVNWTENNVPKSFVYEAQL